MYHPSILECRLMILLFSIIIFYILKLYNRLIYCIFNMFLGNVIKTMQGINAKFYSGSTVFLHGEDHLSSVVLLQSCKIFLHPTNSAI